MQKLQPYHIEGLHDTLSKPPCWNCSRTQTPQ